MKRLAALAPLLIASAIHAAPQAAPQAVPSGVVITPEAARGALFQPLNPDLKDLPDFTAGQASSVALSPDGRTLAILTSGFNRNFNAKADPVLTQSGEYLFLYDVTGPKPAKRQVLGLADSYIGLAWAPDGQRLYASGGVDDAVVEFKAGAEGFTRGRTLALGHSEAPGLYVTPHAAGLAISPNGQKLLVANYQNDSVSLIDLAAGKVTAELDLRPGRLNPADHGKPGGTFPRAVAFIGDDRAVVGVERDRELVALEIGPASLKLAARRKVKGQPTALLVNRDGSRLYAALDNTDRALVIDPRTLAILESIATAAPQGVLKAPKLLGGAGSNALALSPDGKTLLVSNGGENAVAVVRLSAVAQGQTKPARTPDSDGDDDEADAKRADVSKVVGLIPTGWYPTGVAFNRAGDRIFAINGKSPPGLNPGGCRNSLSLKKDLCRATNQYVWQLEKAGFLTLPAPSGTELARLTRQVADNNGFSRTPSYQERQVSAFLRAHIKHVIFIVKENRTYDQVLGDLQKGDGDPKLTLFPEANTPNHHALARNFVTLDRFFDSGESSNTGWNWTVAGRTTDFTEREAPVNYAARGLQYDQEGTNRNVNVGYATSAERQAAMPLSPADPDALPGTADVAAPDAPGGVEGKGYILGRGAEGRPLSAQLRLLRRPDPL
jgi:YVTN family beta-propeller protein